ncbi:MAG TPA: hypothetical protein VF530_01260, partial [Planctomycetota bacterium]
MGTEELDVHGGRAGRRWRAWLVVASALLAATCSSSGSSDGGNGGDGGGGGGGGGGAAAAPYWRPGPFKALRPADVVGTWIAQFGLGMNKQIFTFLRVGNQLRGVVCGRCDNTYTIGAMENIIIAGDKVYFDIVHEDWGETNPPRFARNIVAQITQNEMIASILGKDLVIDPARPPAR